MVIGSDGLWDAINGKRVMKILKKYKTAQRQSMALTQEAFKKGSLDNISVVVVNLAKYRAMIMQNLDKKVNQSLLEKRRYSTVPMNQNQGSQPSNISMHFNTDLQSNHKLGRRSSYSGIIKK